MTLTSLPPGAFSPGSQYGQPHSGWFPQGQQDWYMLPRLLASCYRALDKSPFSQVAFRCSHQSGFAWEVTGRKLYANTETGTLLVEVATETATVAEAYSTLQSAGCQGVYLNPDMSDLSAAALVSGHGRESDSDGNAVYAYTSLLWAMLDGMALALEHAGAQIPEAILQCNYADCGGEFMDFWGIYWGFMRMEGETDADYLARTIAAILMPKNNAYAMANAASSQAGVPVEIYEPWRDVLFLNENTLGVSRLPDGVFWDTCLYQPTADGTLPFASWALVLSLLDAIKPAGVVRLHESTIGTVRFAETQNALIVGFGQTAIKLLGGDVQPRFNITTETA